MSESLECLIRGKFDSENANRLIALGYPTVAPVLPHMVEWIQDMNWPVAKLVAPFLGSLGAPILPEIRKVLDGDDLIWKYWVISELIGRLPVELAKEFRADLERLAFSPTDEERLEELDQQAKNELERLNAHTTQSE